MCFFGSPVDFVCLNSLLFISGSSRTRWSSGLTWLPWQAGAVTMFTLRLSYHIRVADSDFESHCSKDSYVSSPSW